MRSKTMRGNKIFLFLGIGILLVFLTWALLPDLFLHYDIKESFRPLQKPSAEHWLGTNDLGYDIYSELIKSASTTLTIGFVSALISIVIGTVMGLLSGYIGGVTGEILNGIINVFLLIPMLPMIVVFSAYFGGGLKNIILIISLLGWCSTARAVRARVRQLKQLPYIEALIILGIPHRDIVFKHILPNIAEVISARYILTVASCMLTEASVSFLGLGDPVQVTWGGMVSVAFRRGGFVRGLVNWYLAPGCCIMLCSLAFFLINQYLDSRTKSVHSNYLE
ncbi:MAG: ABC transporter permease [Oscillospiraceae bacterium]